MQNVVDTSRPLTSRPILMIGGGLILLFIVTGYLVTAKDVPSLSELAALPVCIVLIVVFDRSPAIGALCVLISIPFGGIELPVLERTPKMFFTTLLSLVLIVTMVPKLVMRLRPHRGSSDGLSRLRGTLLKLAVVYCGLVVLSVFQAIDFQRSAYMGGGRLLAFAVFLIALNFPQTLQLRVNLLRAVAVVGGLIAIIYILGNLQVYDTSTLQSFTSDIVKKDNLASAGMLGVSNTIASFMSFTVPLTMALIYLRGRPAKERVLALISLMLQLATLVITNSRGGVVALGAGGFVAALFVPGTLTRANSFFKWAGGLVLFSLIGYAAFALAPADISGRYETAFSSDALAYGIPKRLELFNSSWEAFQSNLFFGAGVGNIGFYDLHFGTGAGSETHNLILQTMAEEGIFSTILLFSILGIMGYRLVFLLRKNPGAAQMWALAAYLACLLDAMIEPTFWALQFVNLFWISMAILICGPLVVPMAHGPSLQHSGQPLGLIGNEKKG